jgi:hypothetical protein
VGGAAVLALFAFLVWFYIRHRKANDTGPGGGRHIRPFILFPLFSRAGRKPEETLPTSALLSPQLPIQFQDVMTGSALLSPQSTVQTQGPVTVGINQLSPRTATTFSPIYDASAIEPYDVAPPPYLPSGAADPAVGQGKRQGRPSAANLTPDTPR